jgi:predicted permease
VSSIFVQGRQPLPNEQMAFDASVVGPRYHETMGIEMAQGRGFTEQDREGAPAVVIINEALAQRLFPGENALGRKLTLGTNGPPLEIVGITRDVKHHELTETPVPHFDLPALQRGYDSYTNVVLRTRGPAEDLIPSVRSELLALDPALPVKGISAVSADIDNTLAATRLASTLISIFGVVALLLASIGLYGVMAWMVSQRTREVGIRMALGAQTIDVLNLVIRDGLKLVLIGTGVGLAGALLLTRLMTTLLFGVTATDALTYVTVALTLIIVALIACCIPACRATKVDPLIALRFE